MHFTPQRIRYAQRSTQATGFTLIEVVVASTILMIAMLAMASTLAGTSTLRSADRQRRIAQDASQSIIHWVNATSATAMDVPETWSQTVVDALAAPNDSFEVHGLTPHAGQVDCASIQLITNETLTDQELGVALGMPRDLDGDGAVNNIDVSASARLLPVLLSLRWAGAAGERQMTQGFYVAGY